MDTPVSAPLAADKLIADFDRAWQSGQPPQLEAYLRLLPDSPDDDGLRRDTCEELVRIDLEYRWRRGLGITGDQSGGPLLEHYQARHADLQRWGPLSPDLIAWEYRVRHCWGDHPGHAEYVKRFPDHGPSLLKSLQEVDTELAREFGRVAERTVVEDVRVSPVPVAGPAASSAPPAAVAGLLDVLRREELLSKPQVAELVQNLQHGTAGPHELARDLIRRSWLTPYQVNHLLQGRASELRLGPYLLLERLGEGGAGQVFKARHLHMNRVVALKVIHKDLLSDEVVVSRFQREMRLVGQLQHPHIVHANDAGTIGAMHVLVMEYADGIDLARLVKQSGPLAVPLACECIRQAAAGLAYIHERGLVHRDIKPSNLLVTVQPDEDAQRSPGPSPSPVPSPVAGRPLVKILDLGLARLCCKAGSETNGQPMDTRSTDTLTLAGSVMIMGTPDYLAPEQALDFHGADIRADIYSLGCTFFYLLTGRPPFQGGTVAQKLKRHQQEEPPSVRQLRPEVPEEVCQLLARMLAKRPEERFQTPGELIAALTRTTPRISSTRRRWRRWIAVAGAGLFLVAMLVGLFAMGPSGTAPDRQRAGQVQALRDRVNRRPAAVDRPLWQDVLDFRMRNAATPEALEASAWLSQLPSALDALPGPPHAIVATLPGRDERSHGLALSPDNRLAAMIVDAGKERKLRLWDLTTQKELPTFEGVPAGAFGPTFSPDGRLLAVAGSKGVLKLWQCGSGKPVGPFKAKNHIRCLAFSPDGQKVAIGTQAGEVQVWDVVVGGEGPTWRDHTKSIHAVTFSPDGGLLAAGCQDRPMIFWNTATGRPLANTELPPANSVVFAPDSRTAILTSHGGKTQLWEAGPSGWTMKMVMDGLTPLAFTADGTKLLHLGPQRSIALSDLKSLPKTAPVSWQLPGKGGTDSAVLASDMRHLAILEPGGAVIIVRLAPLSWR
jgi:serine/threonine protein kinase